MSKTPSKLNLDGLQSHFDRIFDRLDSITIDSYKGRKAPPPPPMSREVHLFGFSRKKK